MADGSFDVKVSKTGTTSGLDFGGKPAVDGKLDL